MELRGVFKTATLSLVNNGSGPLTINQNGISVPAGQFSVTGIVSNTQGGYQPEYRREDARFGRYRNMDRNGQFDPTALGLSTARLDGSSVLIQPGQRKR